MNRTIRQLLEGRADNRMLPFLWLHGEDEQTLRKYVAVIREANCHAVCVESRPHPDFCGDRWWRDLDIILDEARRREMQVWILDDSHFPTGYANGAMKGQPERLRKQSIYLKQQDSNELPQGDRVVYAAPEGFAVVRTVRTEGRADYINVTEPESCRVLLDAVYEPHWARYATDFGTTVAGFFSDEPELGNGRTYAQGNVLGTEQELPWGDSVEAAVSRALGEGWRRLLPLLWLDGEDAPRVRSIYMDCVTRLVRDAFSRQIGDWCRAHGVRYIGHIIEDGGQHCRTGSSMGHYFRSLQGQDMAGIDNIGGQVLPQGEDDERPYFLVDSHRPAEFWHYALAALARSAAAIEPGKHGSAMCEIFGNYGWREGTKLEKYQADHFLVRGINHFVPHAFSPKAFPDPDCPPHFYANGHDPLIRHFGALCGYMNRVATLTSGGRHAVPVAVLYHGESEWADPGAMPFEKPLRALYDRQIDCHVLPADVFTDTEFYGTKFGNPLAVNGQEYRVFVVPETAALPASAAKGLERLAEHGLPIYFVNRIPARVAETGEPLADILRRQKYVSLDALAEAVAALGFPVPAVEPPSDRIRILQIEGDTPVYFIVNEGALPFEGRITFRECGGCYLYDPWFNVCRPAEFAEVRAGVQVSLTVEPLKSVAVVFGPCDAPLTPPIRCAGEGIELPNWTRSTCRAVDYPEFRQAVPVTLPDNIAEIQPEFSGFARYETAVPSLGDCILEIMEAEEAVEVFLNGESLGLQIAPPFRYALSLTGPENRLAIEVATTLERQCYPLLDAIGKQVTPPPTGQTGLLGPVRLYRRD